MIDALAWLLFGAAGLVAVAVIVWEVYRHWPAIVRLSHEAGDERPLWIEWRIIATRDDEDLAA